MVVVDESCRDYRLRLTVFVVVLSAKSNLFIKYMQNEVGDLVFNNNLNMTFVSMVDVTY